MTIFLYQPAFFYDMTQKQGKGALPEISRYHRQEMLKEIGKKGQEQLAKSRVAVLGIGAIGTATAELLARAGIGRIELIDRDIVELHNLQRQSLFTENDCNKPKAVVAAEHLKKINSAITIESSVKDMNHETIEILKDYDLVLDCTDNMETRFLLNDFCVNNSKPWIYASAVGTKGRVLVFMPIKSNPCFRCLFSPPAPGSLETCDTVGVLNTVTATIASLQVTEALKILTNQEPTKELIAYDIWMHSFEKIKVKKKKECLCCEKKQFTFLEGKKETSAIKLCGQGRIQIRGKMPNMQELEKRLQKIGKVTKSEYGIYFVSNDADFFLFPDGRCLVKATTKEEAKAIYAKFVGN